ncbi:hypothetical protein ACOBQX_07695 [Actinokineospora sp. G85]|uniref:hypothetical protein n=1 Tax=Actinokineospora sp. G85 TaxID=3406626 RepID=UPI003C73F872
MGRDLRRTGRTRVVIVAGSAMPSFLSIAEIVFKATAQMRKDLHRVRGALGCDARFDLKGRFRVSGGCPCVDEFTEAVVVVWNYLLAQDPAVVGSYEAMARTHCRVRVVNDLLRARRGARGLQRTDHLAESVIGRALATDEQRALLRHIADEAGSAAPLESEAQLFDRLALLRAVEFGGTAAEHLAGVCADLPVVRAAAIRHGKRQRDSYGVQVSWWERYVEAGLGMRHRLGLVDSDVVAGQVR